MNRGEIFTLTVSRATCRSPSVDSAEQLLYDCWLHLLQIILKSHPVQWQKSLLLWRNEDQLDPRNGINLTCHSTYFLAAHWCIKNNKKKTAAFPQTGWKKVSEFKRLKQKTQMATIIQYWKEKQTCLMKLALRDSHRPAAVVFVVIVIIL